jgi:hypothetical protein
LALPWLRPGPVALCSFECGLQLRLDRGIHSELDLSYLSIGRVSADLGDYPVAAGNHRRHRLLADDDGSDEQRRLGFVGLAISSCAAASSPRRWFVTEALIRRSTAQPYGRSVRSGRGRCGT